MCKNFKSIIAALKYRILQSESVNFKRNNIFSVNPVLPFRRKRKKKDFSVMNSLL